MNNTLRVLVTGASSGIGLELAREFARHGHPVVLTAPGADELRMIASRIRTDFGVEATAIARDLTDESAPAEIFDELQARGLGIHILVNNAGVGEKGEFAHAPLYRDITTIRLNVEAVVRMTKLFLPNMLARNEGRILNTASVAGFEPGPLLAVYHASKAFTLSFSESLAVELENTGVTVTALCPGPVDTDFFPKAHMTESRIFQKGSVMAPREVAMAAYKAVIRGDMLFVPGGMNKALAFMHRVTPVSTQARMNKRFYEDVSPEERKRDRGDVEKEFRRKTRVRAVRTTTLSPVETVKHRSAALR